MKNEVTEKNGVTKAIVKPYDLTSEIPELAAAREVPADLTSEYWTPEKEGEYRLVFYQNVEPSIYVDEASGEEVELSCAILIQQKEDLSLVTIRNGSKRLVAALEDAEISQKIQKGTPLKITFLGKQKNKNNAFLSDRWSVRPLSI